MIHTGDCLEVMPTLDAGSVDAVVTDPPYDLTSEFNWGTLGQGPNPKQTPHRGGGGFMGKAWDGTGIAFRPETWAECIRLAKPGAYLLAFGGTRTYHRMTCAIEDAGWIIRDCLVWAYASGFPKSKALLKPAWEPIVMARKPGPLRELAIDACRISTDEDRSRPPGQSGGATYDLSSRSEVSESHPSGRWPANLILTDPIFDGDTSGVVGGGEAGSSPLTWSRADRTEYGATTLAPRTANEEFTGYGDSGTYSRFFLIPKADRAEREPILPSGLRGELRTMSDGANGHDPARPILRENVHPTVKPLDLMRHLVRLVTPTGGTVLDPFLGSGTTAIAAEMEGFAWIGIEREESYVEIARARLNGVQRGLGLEVG